MVVVVWGSASWKRMSMLQAERSQLCGILTTPIVSRLRANRGLESFR
jgi:hypothetical protein